MKFKQKRKLLLLVVVDQYLLKQKYKIGLMM